MSQSYRPTYSEEQVLEWLKYIGVSDRVPKDQCDSEAGLDYLNKLLPRQLYTVPFENLDLHYSVHKQASIDTEFLYQKIVGKKAGRGGYCFQNNLFFGTMLRALGYKAVGVGARVSSAATGVSDPAQIRYNSLTHMVNLVFIQGKRYFCDVGFGSNCPTLAIPLEDGWTERQHWSKHDDMLLTWDHILENTARTEQQKLWIFHRRSGEDKPWLPMYCFTELEFLPQDYEMMNFWVSRSLKSFFTYSIVLSKCILDESGRDIGDLTMFGGTVKARKYGQSEILTEAKSEQERVQALEKHFGLKLEPNEITAIIGYVSMIR